MEQLSVIIGAARDCIIFTTVACIREKDRALYVGVGVHVRERTNGREALAR